jgi:hypothetical protein
LSIARRACVLALVVGLVPAAQAADPPAKAEAKKPAHTETAKPAAPAPEVDDELLEFLGSVDADSEDEDWLDYLSQTDIAKVAKDKKK